MGSKRKEKKIRGGKRKKTSYLNHKCLTLLTPSWNAVSKVLQGGRGLGDKNKTAFLSYYWLLSTPQTQPALPSGNRWPWVLERAACPALAIWRGCTINTLRSSERVRRRNTRYTHATSPGPPISDTHYREQFTLKKLEDALVRVEDRDHHKHKTYVIMILRKARLVF